jgi:hypothetical protein
VAELPLPSVRFLTRDQAAAYVGVSATTFAAELRAGMWPPALRRGGKGAALTWDRRLLDQCADRLGGLIVASTPGSDLAAAEQAALKATRGTTPPNRTQHRNSKAA